VAVLREFTFKIEGPAPFAWIETCPPLIGKNAADEICAIAEAIAKELVTHPERALPCAYLHARTREKIEEFSIIPRCPNVQFHRCEPSSALPYTFHHLYDRKPAH
jgi:hypothetical protein